MKSLIGIGLITLGFLAGNLITGQAPLLGLDLQGGVEVVLQPKNPDLVTPEALEKSLEIIRDRVDALGVAEPDITLQGINIVAQLPGVQDQERAVNLIGQTAELRFRPVLAGPVSEASVEEAARLRREREATEDMAREDAGEDAAGEDAGEEAAAADAAADAEKAAEERLLALANLKIYSSELTPPEEDAPDVEVILPLDPEADEERGRYQLGPSLFTGASLEGAQAVLTGARWYVQITAREGPEGIDKFNEAASICYRAVQGICPGASTRSSVTGDITTSSGRLAVVLDHVVQSAPLIRAPEFKRDEIVISGEFSEDEARELALVLDYGALPLEFADPAESGLVRTVSATLGRDDLKAGLIAGLVGLGLVAIYMISYYRLLGLAAIGSLAVSGVLLWVILSFLSAHLGLALTLAGVTGLIVAVGVSLDSNVVYFEHLKEDIRRGQTLRSAVDQSFPVAFKTIFWANLAMLIGAGILWLLTIGSVRGFAAMLAIASILDLVATYFFLRPVVRMLARRARHRPNLVGMPPSTVSAGARA